MKMKERQVTLKNELQVALKSVSEEEAEQLLAFMQKAYAETDYMGTSAEEVSAMNVGQVKDQIEKFDKGKRSIMLSAYNNGEIIANCVVRAASANARESHRATIGVCVKQDFWDIGLGSELLKTALDFAGKVGYEQIEVDAVSQNVNCLLLLNKFEFQPVASLPRAQKLENGEYRDYYRLVKYLKKNEA